MTAFLLQVKNLPESPIFLKLFVMNVEEVVLEGQAVRLEPLRIEHLAELTEVGLEESIWRWTPSQVTNSAEMKGYIETALEQQETGLSLPFVTKDAGSGRIIGSTRYCNIDTANRRAEIGWTWIAPAWQRTRVNTEAKYLMFRHAFEVWKCIRVELKTDALNEKSRNAILRIGAKFEGILRQQLITDAGRFRDTVYFSIIDKEWPEVRSDLLGKLSDKL